MSYERRGASNNNRAHVPWQAQRQEPVDAEPRPRIRRVTRTTRSVAAASTAWTSRTSTQQPRVVLVDAQPGPGDW